MGKRSKLVRADQGQECKPMTRIFPLTFFKKSKGMNVAFVSSAFTRNIYNGMVEVTPFSCQGLPAEDDNLEGLVSGGGVDACVLVAAIEGQWKEDIELLKQEYHEGILDLTGAAQ